jgi:hypothetical protein
MNVPQVITDCPPDIAATDFHTPTSGIASLKPDVSSSTSTTPHSSIFWVSTVVYTQWISLTVNESGLSSNTPDTRQPDMVRTNGKATGQNTSTYVGQ